MQSRLNEWGLAGRGFGTFVSWFLLGGDIYTAYTFIAVPALVYAGYDETRPADYTADPVPASAAARTGTGSLATR